jgi:hypothetical protein
VPLTVVDRYLRDVGGDDSDCIDCVSRQGEIKFEESRKHAGLTSRSQISRLSIRCFRIARHFASRQAEFRYPASTPRTIRVTGCLHSILASCICAGTDVKSSRPKILTLQWNRQSRALRAAQRCQASEVPCNPPIAVRKCIHCGARLMHVRLGCTAQPVFRGTPPALLERFVPIAHLEDLR